VWWGGGESVVDSGESVVVEKYWDACSGGGAEKDGIDDGCGGVVRRHWCGVEVLVAVW
jgi:hypothetical protein